MYTRFDWLKAQHRSTFFERLNYDIRRIIYTNLFGHRAIHVQFLSSSTPEPYHRDACPKRQPPCWTHCVCRKHEVRPPHRHAEEDHKWRFVDARIMTTCKRAYEEASRVLYGTNTFCFPSGRELDMFKRQIGSLFNNITSIDLVIKGCWPFDDPLEAVDYHLACIALKKHRMGLKIRIAIEDSWYEVSNRSSAPDGITDSAYVKSRIIPSLEQATSSRAGHNMHFYIQELPSDVWGVLIAHFSRNGAEDDGGSGGGNQIHIMDMVIDDGPLDYEDSDIDDETIHLFLG